MHTHLRPASRSHEGVEVALEPCGLRRRHRRRRRRSDLVRRIKFPSAPRRLHHLRLHHRPLCHRRLHQLRLYHRRLHRCHQASPALAVSYSPHMRPDTHTHSSALTSIRPAPESGQDLQICACVRALACVHARKRSIGMRGGGGGVVGRFAEPSSSEK